MPALAWSPELILGVPAMDATHREFVALLAALEAAPDEDLVAALEKLIEHTQRHFDDEDRYMRATGFPATHYHATHHTMVLGVMRQGLVMGRAGELAAVRRIAGELAIWFVQHAETMDSALAAHLRRTGFDPGGGGGQADGPLA